MINLSPTQSKLLSRISQLTCLMLSLAVINVSSMIEDHQDGYEAVDLEDPQTTVMQEETDDLLNTHPEKTQTSCEIFMNFLKSIFRPKPYENVEVGQIDYVFAQAVLSILTDLTNFEQATDEHKRELASKFLEYIAILSKGNRYQYCRCDCMTIDSFPPLFPGRSGPSSSSTAATYNTFNTVENLGKHLKNTDQLTHEQQRTLEQYKASFLDHSSADPSCVKALCIQFIRSTGYSKRTQEVLESYSLADLCEIIQKLCKQKMTHTRKMIMAGTGYDIPSASCDSHATKAWFFNTYISWGCLFMVTLIIMLADHEAWNGPVLGLEPIFGALLIDALLATSNCLQWQENKQYKKNDCVLF